MTRFASALVAVAALIPAAVQAGIELPEGASQGVATTISVSTDAGPLAGAAVTATYRPGSEVAHTEEVGTTGPDGSLTWTPEDAGIVTLAATTPSGTALSHNASVHFQGVPTIGIIIMVIAGLVLYGGVYRGFKSMTDAPPILPPDT